MVIPTYRRSDRLAPLMDALVAQSLPADRFAVLVVDDASGDETYPRLLTLAREAPFRLSPVRQPVNAAPAVARNVGWKMARPQ